MSINRDGVANSLSALQPWGTTDYSVFSDYRFCYCGKQILNIILKADFYTAAVYHVLFEGQVTVVFHYVYWFNCAIWCLLSCFLEPWISIDYTHWYEVNKLWSLAILAHQPYLQRLHTPAILLRLQ